MLVKRFSGGAVAVLALLIVAGGTYTGALARDRAGQHSLVDEPTTHLNEFQRKLDFMAERLDDVRVDPNAGAGDFLEGGITLEQHRADIAEVQREFTLCYAALQKVIEDKRESGTASAEEMARLEAASAHCELILRKLNSMHLDATKFSAADRKTTWLLDGLEKHRQAVTEVQQLASECPAMFADALEGVEVEARGVHRVSADEPVIHLKEFERKLKFMADRLTEVRVEEGDSPSDIREGGITLQQHEADVAAVRDEFTRCLAALKAGVEEKEASGTATRADRRQFDKCIHRCEMLLSKLNHMHLNASIMGSADRQAQWVIEGMEKHQQTMKEVQKLAAECSTMIHEAQDRLENDQ